LRMRIQWIEWRIDLHAADLDVFAQLMADFHNKSACDELMVPSLKTIREVIRTRARDQPLRLCRKFQSRIDFIECHPIFNF
jgi:hypothetical protein